MKELSRLLLFTLKKKTIPLPLPGKTQSVFKTIHFHILSGIIVGLVPILFWILYHFQFYPKLQLCGRKWLWHPVYIYSCSCLHYIQMTHWYHFHKKLSGVEDKMFHNPVSIPVCSCFVTTASFVRFCLYLVSVFSCYRYW